MHTKVRERLFNARSFMNNELKIKWPVKLGSITFFFLHYMIITELFMRCTTVNAYVYIHPCMYISLSKQEYN